MFEMIDETNTVEMTLTNNRTGHSEKWLVGIDLPSQAYAIRCFAFQQRIAPAAVGTSVTYPEKASTPQEV